MRFRNNIIDSRINDAVKIANDLLLAGSSLINHISKKEDFKYKSGAGIQVAVNLLCAKEPIDIYVYKSINPFSKALGYFDGESIWINSRKIDSLNSSELIGLLLHEYAHYCGYKHGNNYKTLDKCLYSVPYYLSENVELWV